MWRDIGYIEIYVVNFVGFVALYFSFALVATLLTEHVLPRLQIGVSLAERARPRGQRRREIARSMLAIASFSLWGPIVLVLERSGAIELRFEHEVLRIVVELAVLFLWNELHFLAIHRALHTKWLYRHVHRVHHRSTVPSPFSTYSLHPVEAFLLGSVMVPVLLVVSLDIVTLVLFPVVSIAFNTLGHAAYEVRGVGVHAARDHLEHHKTAREHYGFFVFDV